MTIRDEEAGGYGPREDDTRPYSTDEETQPLQIEEFEIDGGDHTNTTTPRFMRHKLSSAHRGHLLSTQAQRACHAARTWINGCEPPRIQVVTTWLPSIQEWPTKWLDKQFPLRRHKIALLMSFYLCWILAFAILLAISTDTGKLDGSEQPIQYLDCVDTFWRAGNACGLDGDDCRPFNGSSFAFRCPGNCANVRVLNPHHVGAQEIVYRPLVIGGPIYRGDSFICGSAIHAGLVSDAGGGCGIVSRVGRQDNYPSTQKNGITTIGFDSYFPSSFIFTTNSSVKCKARDLRWPLLVVSVVFTTLFSVFTTSPSLQFFTIFTSLFAHVCLVSDPSGVSDRSVSVLADLFSNYIGRFLPAAFCAVVIYLSCVKRSLTGLSAQIEKTILWLGGAWIGTLSNYTFDWIPISRLTSHDLEQQPGAKLALAIIVTILIIIIAQQIYYFRLEGRLPRYLALYGAFAAAITISLILPGVKLRIHHYILALLLLPGTSLQTRPSLFYQGLLIGLFINGVGRWGFDSVLQTPKALQGDAAFDSLLPSILEPKISLGSAISNITFTWAAPPLSSAYDGITILINDVERYRSYFGETTADGDHFTWTRTSSAMPEYFRFGYLKESRSLDYTKAGIWHANGSWTKIEPG